MTPKLKCFSLDTHDVKVKMFTMDKKLGVRSGCLPWDRIFTSWTRQDDNISVWDTEITSGTLQQCYVGDSLLSSGT